MACTIQYHNARTIEANRQQAIEDQAATLAAQVYRSADIIERSTGFTRECSLQLAERLLFRD